MTNTGLFRHGRIQSADIFDIIDFPQFPEPIIMESKAKTATALEQKLTVYANIQFERVYKALLGDYAFNVLSNMALSDSPNIYYEMRNSLVGSMQPQVDRHLLTFLYEVHSDLDAEIQRYKSWDFTLNPLGPHMVRVANPITDPPIFSDPHQAATGLNEAMHQQAMQRARDAGHVPSTTVYCFSLGNVAEHFRAYFKKLYNRARFMQQFIDFCAQCSWINQDIATLRSGAQILNNEIDGIVLTYIAADAVIDAGFSLRSEYQIFHNNVAVGAPLERDIQTEDRNLGIPITRELLPTFSLHSLHQVPGGSNPTNSTYFVPTSIQNENVMSVKNDTSSVIPVYSGTTKLLDVPARSAAGVPGSGNIPASAFREKVSFVAPT